jgi:hypothetical protein
MVKQLASLALAVCLLVGLCCPASAAVVVPDGTFSSDYFASYGCIINDNGGHVLHITFTTTGVGVCDEIGVANYQVEKLVTLDDGSQMWAGITGLLPGITRTNTSFCTYGVNFQGVAGERYRVRATFICEKTFSDGSHGVETKSVCTTGCTVN